MSSAGDRIEVLPFIRAISVPCALPSIEFISTIQEQQGRVRVALAAAVYQGGN